MANLTPENKENIYPRCDQGKRKRNYELSEHPQQENNRHSEALVDVIGNLRNELAELKRDREKCDASDREKNLMIESMRKEIESMKLEKAVLEQRVENLSNILDGKADKTVLDQRVDNLGNILDSKVDKLVAENEAKLKEMRREWRGTVELQQLALANVEERNETKYRTEIADRIDSVEKCLAKINPDFVMKIDKMYKKVCKGGHTRSEMFIACAELYEMRLDCYYFENFLEIYFLVSPDDRDEPLRWPFDRNVTIAITNENRPNASKAVTMRRTVENNFYSYYNLDIFRFKLDELEDEGLLYGDHLVVQCFIRPR